MQGVYGQTLDVLLADIQSVSTSHAGFGKAELRVNGGGTTLANVKMPSKWAEKAAAFIRSEIPQKDSVAPASQSSLDELKKLAELKEAGVVTQEEFEAKKKQLLDG